MRRSRQERKPGAAIAGTAGVLGPEQGRGEIEIPCPEWRAFLDSFSVQHLHWRATIEATTPEGLVAIVEDRPFEGISSDHSGGSERIYIQMGERVAEQMTHIIQRPRRVAFQQTPSGEHQGLKIYSADGRTTFLRFRSRVRPELLDGV